MKKRIAVVTAAIMVALFGFAAVVFATAEEVTPEERLERLQEQLQMLKSRRDERWQSRLNKLAGELEDKEASLPFVEAEEQLLRELLSATLAERNSRKASRDFQLRTAQLEAEILQLMLEDLSFAKAADASQEENLRLSRENSAMWRFKTAEQEKYYLQRRQVRLKKEIASLKPPSPFGVYVAAGLAGEAGPASGYYDTYGNYRRYDSSSSTGQTGWLLESGFDARLAERIALGGFVGLSNVGSGFIAGVMAKYAIYSEDGVRVWVGAGPILNEKITGCGEISATGKRHMLVFLRISGGKPNWSLGVGYRF